MPDARHRSFGIAALLLVGGAASSFSAAAEPEPVPVHVVAHGWHTAIILELTAEVIERCPALADFRHHRFVEIGWGDEGFYRADSITIGTTIRAIGWPNPSVLHVAGFDETPARAFPESGLVRLAIPAERFPELLAAIAARFAARESLGPGIVADSRFYRATGSYYFANTCNVWTLRVLAEAGVPTSPTLGIRAEAAMAQLARQGTVIRLDPPEAKWPYALAALGGGGAAAWRLRRRARSAAPPSRDRDLCFGWIGFVLGAAATLAFIALSANSIEWANPATRVAIGGIVASLGAILIVAGGRIRARCRLREAMSGALAALGIIAVLSPL